MSLWTMWLDTLRALLELLSSSVGLGPGLAIIVLTFIVRVVLLPASWTCVYRSCLHQKRVRRLQPELERIKQRFHGEPGRLAEQTLEVYRKRGVRMIEPGPIAGTLIQMPVLLGMFQVLRQGVTSVRFLWIANLSRPDIWIAAIVAATTALMMLANPDLPEQTRILLIVLPSIIAFVFALKFASALALYWAASNCFTAAQTAGVHYVVGRRIRSGAMEL